MYIGVIRNDIPQAISLSGLEPISRFNPMIEPEGQEYMLARPTETGVDAALASVAPSIMGGTNITFPLVINAGNQTLRIRTASSGAFTVVTVPAATYNDISELSDAVTAALDAAGVAVRAQDGSSELRLMLVATEVFGAGSTLSVDSVANGSTFNTPSGIGAAAVSFTVDTAANILSLALPLGGPLDVSGATLLPLVGASVVYQNDLLAAFRSSIALKIHETSVVQDALKAGVLKALLSVSYSPDPNRFPPGAAISIVEDDGSTAFTPAGLPVLASAVLAGNLTLTGTDLASPETYEMIVSISGSGAKKIYQKAIELAGGTVTATSIVVPASLFSGVAVGASSVKVQFRSFMSNQVTVSL